MTQTDFILILAPLQGFTDLTFRTVTARHFSGLDLAIAPFISTMGNQKLNPNRLRDLDPALNLGLPTIPQIMGNSAEDFIFLADRLFDLGHAQVNWNLGCPHAKVAKKQRGSGLLLHPERIHAILSRIIPEMKPDLSVKIRLGRRNKDEIKDLLAVFDCHDLTEIILHPRTGEQMYTGLSDVEAFAAAQKMSRHPFVYNGDITDQVSFDRIRACLPRMRRFMIGRGIMANPFLAEDLKGYPVQDQETRHRRLKAFHDDLLDSYQQIYSGPGHLIGHMKGVWGYLGPSFEGHRKPLKLLLKANSVPAYQDRVQALFDLPFLPKPETCHRP